MLLATVVIWALNITVTKYVLTHGFLPLAYSSVRYGASAILFAALTFALERSFRIGGRRSLLLVGAAVVFLYANQLAFVYAIKLTTATTAALILGTTPIFTALVSSVVGLEQLSGRFWLAAATTSMGVALVALGTGSGVSGNLWGDLIALGMAASWAFYSVTIAPLMRTYSPYRISALVLVLMWIPLALTGLGQLHRQSYGGLGWLTWLCLAYAIVGPLTLTNVLWFKSIDRVGPSRASLFANLQPFVAAIFALLLLSEKLTKLEVVGGFAIAGGILLERRRRAPVPVPAE